jgi:hypothetical protein
MLRLSSILPTLAVGCALVLRPVTSDAQLVPTQAIPRFEITPLAGYQWGGSFDTDHFANIPAGQLEEESSFAWGGLLSFLTSEHTAVELMYLRQDTDLRFDPVAQRTRELGGFANNYIQLGGRWELLPQQTAFHPFIAASLGINILDPEADNLDSRTKFSWTLGGGARYMFGSAQRVGIRADVRWLVTPVPSGDLGTWCDFYGCFVTEGTSWVSQGTAMGGIVIAF